MITSTIPTTHTQPISLDDWMQNPPNSTEWINGELIKKNGMTLKHSRIQSKVSSYWRTHKDSNELGGEVYTEAPCRTNKQGRCPDVAYLPPELVSQYGDAIVQFRVGSQFPFLHRTQVFDMEKIVNI